MIQINSLGLIIENFPWSDRSINYLSRLIKQENQLNKEKSPRLTSAMQLLTRPFKQLYERVYITIIRYIFPTIRIEGRIVHTAQKMKSSIKDFLRVSCGFGYTY